MELKKSSPAQTAVNNIAYVDTIDACNLKCPTCIRGSRGMTNSGKRMSLEKFQMMIEKLASEGHGIIGLFNWIEPFLNQILHEYISVVKRHNLICMVSSNFSLRRIPGLEAVFRSGLDHLIVSVSGFEQEVYEINHANGNIAYVKDNLQRAAKLKGGCLVVLRFIKFYYNHDQQSKLESFARDLGLGFEIVEGSGDPKALAPPATNEFYEDRLRSFRSERPFEAPGKVCPLIFGNGSSFDHNGMAYLCCAYPNYDALRIGSYLDLPQEEILLRKYNHPMCASCPAPRRDATPEDEQALLEAMQFRMNAN